VRATQIRIAVSAVTDVVKMNTAMFIPNAVGIFTASNKVRSRPPGGAGNVQMKHQVRNESVPTELAQCRFHGLAIFSAKI